MNLRFFVIILAAASGAVLASAGVYWLLLSYGIYQTDELVMDLYIGDKLGLNVDNDALHLGIVPPGLSGSRNIKVSVPGKRTMVSLYSEGEIAPLITISDNNFIMEPHENRTIEVIVNVPVDAKNPDYLNGTIKIVFRNA